MSISDNKGNWEFNFFQKKYDPIQEANIKLSMKVDNCFNPKDVHKYINPPETKEEIIMLKQKSGLILKTTEEIILQNYLKKKKNIYENDMKMIKQFGLGAKPQTMEGKTKLLLETLKYQIQKNNKDLVVNIYLRMMEDSFNITSDMKNEYNIFLDKMEKIIQELDIIQLQFTKFHSQMPPLNTNGFKKLDSWQIDVINNIDNNISTIINAPTSAGKSVLSAYTTTKGKVLYIVPTDSLAWQTASYLTNIIGENIPILTITYQTSPNRYEMINLLNKASAIVGTADAILNYLPFIKLDFSWLVLDEIHMIGKEEGQMMEPIIKLLSNTSILALSATIDNIDELVLWFNNILNKPINKIICDKRFFNLQKYYYSNKNLKVIHPLSLVNLDDIKDRSILNKLLQPTPPDIWDFAIKLDKKIDLEELKPYNYFLIDKRIELNDANDYFNKLLLFVVDNYNKYNIIIDEIINNYKHDNADIDTNINLVELAFKLKNDHKTPAIIFQSNTLSCLTTVREFAKNIEDLEFNKYPKLFNDRLKQSKLIKKNIKNIPTENIKHDKKATKQMMGDIKLKKDEYGSSSIQVDVEYDTTLPSLQEPHEDFIFNNSQYFTENKINDWLVSLKKYFPNTGTFYHYIIKLLWRGIGVYAKGLPDPYLRLVQSLACQKQLAIVFSDQSLVFGISMPFRSVVLLNNNNDIDTMLYHQMIGRAGRRGQDKEGHIIFAGYKWDMIKHLSLSKVPMVYGADNILYTIHHANKISELMGTKQNWDTSCKNFLNNDINENEITEQLVNIESNYKGGWDFAINKDNINHLYMNWKFRNNDDSLLISYLFTYIKRAFENKDHTIEINQINIAHFLCRFISAYPVDMESNIMEDPSILLDAPYNQILNNLENLQIEVPKNVDNKIYLSIQNNLIVNCKNEVDSNDLRNRIMDFGEKVKNIQHYCFHSKHTSLSKLLGKLLTRIWWIYHLSSPIMKSINDYEN